MPNRYHGTERRKYGDYHVRIEMLEFACDKLSREVKCVVAGIGEYKSFIELLRARETQKLKIRDTLIEKGITAFVLSAAGVFCAVVWYALRNWLQEIR